MTDDVPSTHELPPPHLNLKHSLVLTIPLPSTEHAQTVYRVLSVDRPLRPKDAFLSFRVVASPAPPAHSNTAASLDISVHTSSIRQMRLSSNAILDDVSLILETMDAFQSEENGAPKEISITAAPPPSDPDQEFELNGTGRAG